MATEKGTWTKENIKRAEAIKFALYNLPIIHYTTESRCKLPKNDDRDGTYWLENIDQEGLLSAEKVVEIGGIHPNTYIEDIEIDRHKYVYACLGELYFAGAPQRDMCAMILNKSLLKLPSTLIQDQKFQKQLGLGNLTITSFSNKNEMYQDFNESSLTATDYITLMSLGISTGTIDYNSTFPEVMLRDNVPSNKIDCILQPTEQDEITDEECVIFTSKMDTISNNSGKPKYGVYDKTVSVPQEIFYKLHEKSTLAPDTSFKSKPQPWYKKAVAAISK